MMTTQAILAIDGGGTGSRALLCDANGTELGRASGQFANLVTDFERSRQHLADLIDDAYKSAGRARHNAGQDVAVLGVAGAEISNTGARLAATLDFSMTRVLSDRDIAVTGILADRNGTVAQIGTGSFFVQQRDGARRHIGGWGLALGDEASGAWLGRELLRSTLHAHDGLIASSPLTTEIMTRFDNKPDEMVLFAGDALPGDFAAFVPVLFDAFANHDPVARLVVGHGIDALETVLGSLETASAGDLFVTGGVGKRYQQHLSDRFRSRLAAPAGDALSGAVRIGRDMLKRAD